MVGRYSVHTAPVQGTLYEGMCGVGVCSNVVVVAGVVVQVEGYRASVGPEVLGLFEHTTE